MAQATDGEISQYPNQIRGEIFFQRDLLQRLMTGKCRNNKEPPPSPDEEPSDVELNLGLSLGGCFAAEQKENKLVRSSSIADPATVWRLPESVGLVRSCSVPANLLPESLERSMEPGIVATAAEDRRRRRMELHALKRKRWMGLEGCRVKDRAGWGGDGGKQGGLGKGESSEEDKEEDEEETLTLTLMGGKREGCTGAAGGQPPQHGIGNGVSFPYMVPGAGWTGGLNLNGKTGAFMPVASSAFVPASHASLGSQGSSSSGVSEFESKPAQGLNGSTDARSPASVQSLPEQSEQKVIPGMGTAKISGKAAGEEADNLSRKRKMSNAERNVMEEMPCVSTRGEGPNGKRIEGFLYNFKKGEEVRIVCVCHGSFLSPAEFVKHGGGGDVAHPLRHIVVNPSPSFFL